MAIFDKTTVIGKMKATGIVPVFYHSDAEIAKNVVKSCYEGGIRVFEFTNRGDFAQEVFAEVVKFARQHCPEMALGAGSVIDAPTACLYMQLGANFIVGPLFNPEIAKVCNRRLVPYIPGCGTPSEVGFAQEAGCDVCKLFPGETYGPQFVKATVAPMPWTKLMITGGIELAKENLAQWFNAGAFCVGIGSKLFPKDKIKEQDWNYVVETSRKLIGDIQDIRQNKK